VSDDEIVIECDLAAAPDKVWRALTVPELVATWLLTDDIHTLVADAVAPPDGPGSRQIPGSASQLELLAAEPQRTLRYRWSEHQSDGASEHLLESVLSFELTPTAGGTHLRICHGAFRESATFRMMGPCEAPTVRPLIPGRKPPVALAGSWTSASANSRGTALGTGSWLTPWTLRRAA
jgi:uncharacterized protein YndB with AHSA1/START domain